MDHGNENRKTRWKNRGHRAQWKVSGGCPELLLLGSRSREDLQRLFEHTVQRELEMRLDVFLADGIDENDKACVSRLAEIIFVGVAWFEYYEENYVDSGYFKDFKFRVWR